MQMKELSKYHGKMYKNEGKSFENIRKNRHNNTIELRKSRRDELIQKKRSMLLSREEISEQEVFDKPLTLEVLKTLVTECASSDSSRYTQAIHTLRLYLSMEKVLHLEELLRCGIIDNLLLHIGPNETNHVRYEVTWALTNIASGSSEQTRYLFRNNVISSLISLLGDESENLVEQSIWALSNIMGDGPVGRALVLNLNLLDYLPQVFQKHKENTAVIKQFSWMMINICRKKEEEINIHFVPKIIPLLLCCFDVQQEAVISDVLWAITHLADSSQNHIQCMIDSGVVNVVLRYFGSTPKLVISALRAIGNVAASIDEHTQYLLDHNIYHYLMPLFSSDNTRVRKEVYWLLSNIAAGTREQMLTLFSLNIFGQIMNDLENAEYLVRREACWIVSNAIHSCTVEEAQQFINSRLFYHINKFLIGEEVTMKSVGLEVCLILLRIYTNANKQDYICERIEEAGVLDSIENLQVHGNASIYNFATHILEKYFSLDASEADGILDATAQEGTQNNGPGGDAFDF